VNEQELREANKRIQRSAPIFKEIQTLCYLPFMHIEAATTGECKQCCMATGAILRDYSEIAPERLSELLDDIDSDGTQDWLPGEKSEALLKLKDLMQLDNLMDLSDVSMLYNVKLVKHNVEREFNIPLLRVGEKDIGHWNLEDNTITDAFLGKFMHKLRDEFRNGKKPTNCSRCWDEEDAGINSKRISFAEHFSGDDTIPDTLFTDPVTEKNIQYVDLKLGNVCNLKCRICNSMSSSKWAQEDIDSLIIFDGISKAKTKTMAPYRRLKSGNWPNENKNFWNDISENVLPNLKYLEFTGGEPLLIQEQFKLIQQIVDDGLAKNIHLSYNTNGTQLPIHAIENLWPQFNSVRLSFSIDDVGKRYEYQRYGANWDDVHNNITYMLNNKSDNVYMEVTTTVNILNIMNLPDIHRWLRTLPNFMEAPEISNLKSYWYINLLHSPEYLNISLLPDRAKASIEHSLTNYNWLLPSHTTGYGLQDAFNHNILNVVEYMNSNVIIDPDASHNIDLTVLRAKARRKIYKHDYLRKENLQDIDPWLASVLQYDYKEMAQLWLPKTT